MQARLLRRPKASPIAAIAASCRSYKIYFTILSDNRFSKPRRFIRYRYESKTEKYSPSPFGQQTLQLLPPHLQTGCTGGCRQMPPLLPLFPQADKTRVYMETAGSGIIGTVPIVDTARCSGCGRCVAACNLRIITLDTIGRRKFAVIISPEKCNYCGACIPACPVDAFESSHRIIS